MSIWSRIERRIEELAGDFLPDEYRERLNEARRRLAEGEAALAEELLSTLVEERPDHVNSQLLLGQSRLQQHKYAEAIGSFDACLAQADDLALAYVGRGEATLALDRAGEALPFFRRAVDEAGGDRELLASAYRGLGRAYRKSGELDKAIRELRKAVAEDPDHAESVAALGDALAADRHRSNDEARRTLESLTGREGCPPEAWLALGRIALEEVDSYRAQLAFEELLERHEEDWDLRARAHEGLASAALLEGDGERALEALQEAMSRAGSTASLLAKRAQALALTGEVDQALASYQASLNKERSPAVARDALALALRQEDSSMGVELANMVLEEDSSDANALTARARDLARQGQRDAARATYRAALEQGDSLEPLLALGTLSLEDDELNAALELATRAINSSPRSTRARALLARAQAARLGVQLAGDSSWYDLATATQNLCSTDARLSALVSDTAVALAEYDQPLLVAVMGEFSSGKSSFVNAFIGSEIAPMGITPTTATVNVVKYGRERAGRVVYRDQRTVELDGADLQASLRALPDEEVRRIRHVELLMPIAELEKVNIVDTPGLNSILPEHEAVARNFLSRADAVVWLFTANQAGSSTEKKAIDAIRSQGLRVLGVLNKIDQLAEGQVDELLGYVNRELGESIQACVPVSTRRALEGQDGSGWQDMRHTLEEHFFARARQLKHEALARRLSEILRKARDVSNAGRKGGSERGAQYRSWADAVRESQLSFVSEVVEEERARINQAAARLYRSAAVEVLELVRPRKMPFGSHKASPADRDYLLSLLDAGYQRLLAESRERIEGSIRQSLEHITEGPLEGQPDLELGLDEGLELLGSTVFGACESFLRGYLRGGTIDRFFGEELPKIELSEDALYHALFRGAADMDSEITVPLARAGGELLGRVAARLEDHAQREEVALFTNEAGLEEGLNSLDSHLRRLRDELRHDLEDEQELDSEPS